MKKKKVILEKLDLLIEKQDLILSYLQPKQVLYQLGSQPDPPGTPPPDDDE